MNVYLQFHQYPPSKWLLTNPLTVLILILLTGSLFLVTTNSEEILQISIRFTAFGLLISAIVSHAFYTVQASASSKPDAEKPAGEAAAVTTLAVKNNNKTELLRFREIIWLQSDNNAVEINTTQAKYTLYRTLRSIEQELDATLFVRVNRSAIVNRNFIESIHHLPGGDGFVQLTIGEQIRYSRNYKNRLTELNN